MAVLKRAWLLGAGLAALSCGSAWARDVVVSGAKMDRFGRILLQFDQPTKVQVKATNSVLVITFAEPARIRSEKLATELAPYVAVVRRDPDNTGLRLALAAAIRPNVLEAGERVYIDLLPPGWTGLAPGLPPEVVAELAQRAAAAEAKLRAAQAKPREQPKVVKLRIAELPNLTRLVLEFPPGGTPRMKNGEANIEFTFEGVSQLDAGGEKPKLAPGVALFETTSGADSLTVKLGAGPGFRTNVFREGDSFVVDLAKASPAATAQSGPPAQNGPSAVAAHLAEPRDQAAKPPVAPVPALTFARPEPPQVGPAVAPPSPPAQLATKIAPEVQSGPDGTTVRFPFRAPTAAAAYDRAGVLTLLFDTQDPIDKTSLASDSTFALEPSELDSGRGDGLEVIRLVPTKVGPARLIRDGDAWRLTLGRQDDGLPPDTFKVSRFSDQNGRAAANVGIARASKVHWLRDRDGGRVAVVTASGRVQALPVPKTFVEFSLPATLQGIVVDARADDLTVALGQSGVTVGREAGLTLTALDGTAGTAPVAVMLNREVWAGEKGGDVMERYHALLVDAAQAPESGRAEARFRLARFLLANGMNEEAGAVLALAGQEDAVFARRPETGLLSGIAAARAGRPQAARAFLSNGAAQDGAEAALWRAVTDALDRQWGPALAGFAKSADLIDLYPDELAGPIRLSALQAAMETGNLARAERELTAIDRLPTGAIPADDHDLARARLDEAVGRTDAAIRTYRKLMEDGAHPAAAAATERWVALSLKAGSLPPAAAIGQLEALSVAWRGGETEIGTVTQLARLYSQAGRWRDMFEMTRRANKYFPDHPSTRRLHDESAQLIETLLLGTEAPGLSPVQALGLYFDFKELAPIGRRGDQIVRRLADRLVELDLLDQASELLEYQVEKRLTGVARATVAARLAAVRLMNGKPLLALAALQSTRLADLPKEVRQVRFMLEARAHSDLGRTDLALETLDGETGPEFDRVRTSILWTARRWREAGEAGEGLLSTRWSGPEALSERERGDIIRATVAYALAEDRISLDRVRDKFSAKMMDSPDARTFETLMKPGASQTREFRTIAQEATRADALRSLLSDWRGPETDAPSHAGELSRDGSAAPGEAPRTADASPQPRSRPDPARSAGSGPPG